MGSLSTVAVIFMFSETNKIALQVNVIKCKKKQAESKRIFNIYFFFLLIRHLVSDFRNKISFV